VDTRCSRDANGYARKRRRLARLSHALDTAATDAFGAESVSELSDRELAELRELLKDAESCARLSQWETEFCASMQGRLLVYKTETRLSDAQRNALHRIERKVYAT
jgi:hypothetical protein